MAGGAQWPLIMMKLLDQNQTKQEKELRSICRDVTFGIVIFWPVAPSGTVGHCLGRTTPPVQRLRPLYTKLIGKEAPSNVSDPDIDVVIDQLPAFRNGQVVGLAANPRALHKEGASRDSGP